LLACLLAVCGSAQEKSPETNVAAQREPRDFVEYWAAARLFAQGDNPYSPSELLEVERGAGWRSAEPLIMWNPPWVLPLLLPFGYLSFTIAQFFWLLLHALALLIAAQCLWKIYFPDGKSARPSWIVVLTFVPTLFVLIIGQITPLVAVGGAWFLYSIRERRDWAASAGLALLSFKPHLLFLFWIILALWVWQRRLWGLMKSCLVGGFTVALLPLLFDAQIYSKYLALYDQPGITKPLDWPAPTLRNVIRIFLGLESPWLEFLPTVIGAIWVLYYWQRHKNHWFWHEKFPLVTLVSVVSGFFVWTYDHVVMLPALCQAGAWIARSPVPWHRLWTARIYLAINGIHGLLRVWFSEELWYFWLAPALLINYLIFCRERSQRVIDCAPTPSG
jgi:hypothetical protein